MAEITGLTGLRPVGEMLSKITCPPYDVIKPASPLEKLLRKNKFSLYHLTLGKEPLAALQFLKEKGYLLVDQTPCFYVYEQVYNSQVRRGVLAAVAVEDYAGGQIIRHEKTFDDKVKGRLALRQKTGYTFEPVFLFTQADLRTVLDKIVSLYSPEAEFVSDFMGASELHGIKNRIFRVEEKSREGCLLKDVIASQALYIADGHHRYHASLLNQQTHCLAYLCAAADAPILAYNRVINGLVKFAEIKDKLPLQVVREFKTPPKHHFSLYTRGNAYLLPAQKVPEDVVGRLDCRILEKELYPHLGLTADLISDPAYFDYYAENELAEMKDCVDSGKYDLAVALAPVSITELIAVADAGILDPQIVMPEKSTFFAPKILSGIFIYKHKCK